MAGSCLFVSLVVGRDFDVFLLWDGVYVYYIDVKFLGIQKDKCGMAFFMGCLYQQSHDTHSCAFL